MAARKLQRLEAVPPIAAAGRGAIRPRALPAPPGTWPGESGVTQEGPAQDHAPPDPDLPEPEPEPERADTDPTPTGTALPVVAGREAGAGYAAAARALSAVPPIGKALPPRPATAPGLDAAAAAATGLLPLLPGGPAGLTLPLALALLRPDVRRWLGAERMAALAQRLGLREPAVVALFDAMPTLPAALGEAAAWNGRQVPLLGPAGGLLWLALFWRPDRPAGRPPRRRRDRHALAARLVLPATGRIDLRGRLEEGRLDAVLETALPLPRRLSAALQEGFAATLHRLRLQGSLTLRHSEQERQT